MRHSILQKTQGHILPYLLPFAFIALHIFMKPSTADEAEHLHFAYLVGLGMKPYRDFFEHHMPLVWYVFSPVALFSGFLSRIVFYKSMQVVFVALNVLILSRILHEHRKWAAWAFLVFMLVSAPFLDYFDLRPEFIGMPFVVLATAYMIKEPELTLGTAVGMGILCGIHALVTPRLYPFIFVLGVLFLTGYSSVRNKSAFVASALFMAGALLAFFGFSDVYFFVFEISGGLQPIEFPSLHYPSRFIKWVPAILFVIFLLQIYRLRRTDYFFLSLNLLMAALWIIEKVPFPSQSTNFIALSNFIFVYHFFMEHVTRKVTRFFVVLTLVAMAGFMAYRFDIYKGYNFFKVEPMYTSMLEKCKGRTIQTLGIKAVMRPVPAGKVFHPIFTRDYSYFGYFEWGILIHIYDDIIEYNRGRNVKYIDEAEPCFIDSNIARFLRRVVPEPKFVHKVYSPPAAQPDTEE